MFVVVAVTKVIDVVKCAETLKQFLTFPHYHFALACSVMCSGGLDEHDFDDLKSQTDKVESIINFTDGQ